MYYIIVNPASRSGRGKKYWNRLEPYLKSTAVPYTVFFSSYSGQIREIMYTLTKDLTDASSPIHVIILGGDGSINEALQGVKSFDKLLLSYIPTGSSNDFARDLGISKDPVVAMKRLLEQPTRRQLDIGCVEYRDCRFENAAMQKRYFAVSCGLGYDAAVCAEVMQSKMKDLFNRFKLGKLTYLFIALKQLYNTKAVSGELSLEGCDTTVINRLLFLCGMIHRFEGGGFMFAPDADDHDGILDLCSVSNVSKLKVLRVLPTAFKGKHFRFPEVSDYHVSSYTLTMNSPMWLHTDGEILAMTDSVKVTCLKEVLHIMY